MDYQNITFWGVNIPKELENIMNRANLDIIESFENEEQYNAYLLGVKNTVSVLKQFLGAGLSKDSVTFYYPLADVEEEMSLDEICEWVSALEEN